MTRLWKSALCPTDERYGSSCLARELSIDCVECCHHNPQSQFSSTLFVPVLFASDSLVVALYVTTFLSRELKERMRHWAFLRLGWLSATSILQPQLHTFGGLEVIMLLISNVRNLMFGI